MRGRSKTKLRAPTDLHDGRERYWWIESSSADWGRGFQHRFFLAEILPCRAWHANLPPRINGFVKNSELYALSSNFPLRVETDHQALQFNRYVDKGPLSAWALRSVWFHASPGSSDLAGQRQVQQWRTQRNALMKGAPIDHILARDFVLAILAPATLKAPLLAHQLAMLLPTDLLEMVPKRADGVMDDDEVRSRLQIVRVLTLGGSGLVWIIPALTLFRHCVSAWARRQRTARTRTGP